MESRRRSAPPVDVSPQNVLVGSHGISRVADFGVAKCARKNMDSTSEGSLEGKLAHMAPEYVRARGIDRRFDVFARRRPVEVARRQTFLPRRERSRAITLGHPRSENAAVAAQAAEQPVLPSGIESIVPLHLPLKEAREAWTNELENVYVRAMLETTNGNLTKAAEVGRVSRRFFQPMTTKMPGNRPP